jgi:hypothetical protein
MTSTSTTSYEKLKTGSGPPAHVSPVVNQPSSKWNKAYWEIGIAFAVVSIPLSVLSVTLLGVVLGFRTENSLDLSGIQPGDSYLVNLSATTITLIASYSSTIAPIAVGSAMTLILYSVSSQIVKSSEQEHLGDLPTPYQIGLLITMRSGAIGSLWSWFNYAFRWKVRHKIALAVKTGTIALVIGILLSYTLLRLF